MSQEHILVDEGHGPEGLAEVDSVHSKLDMRIVLFSLNNSIYGVDVHQVQSVLDVMLITRVPNAPEYIKGVTNLRGDVIPVVDLRRIFELEAGSDKDNLKMMVVGLGDRAIGVLVDSVMEVVNVSTEDIDDVPNFVSTVESKHVFGVAKYKDNLVVLLDLLNVLSV